MFDPATAPHKVVSGAVLDIALNGGIQNMIANGDSLFAYGGYGGGNDILSPVALRLGVSGTSGGNVLSSLNEYGYVWATQRLDAGSHYSYFCNGEACYQDTNATSSQLGASSETFKPTATTVTVTNGSPTVTASGNAFGSGDATLINATPPPGTNYGYTPSLNQVMPGDLILITDGANKYFHRVTNVISRTVLTIYPNYAGTGGAGKSYSLYRTGYGSYSRIVPIYNSSNGLFYNYYAGLYASNTFPGTIQCFTREASGAASSSHFTCPQNGASQDIKAADIVYYKSYLLYGYGSTVSWSVAGFPTSFTTGFGSTDFPATNVTVVANDDQFISFELVGDQLIAFFKNSIWEVQATGSVPEFNFYRIPEPVGALLWSTAATQTNYLVYRRPTVSARNSVYYHSHTGLMQLSGRQTQNVATPAVRATWQQLGNETMNPGLFWEPSTNTVWSTVPKSTNSSDYGFVYNADANTWQIYDSANSTATSSGQIVRGTSALPTVDNFGVFFYDGSGEKIRQLDPTVGAPYAVGLGTAKWVWRTPIVSTGDEYGGFLIAGFQLDGNYGSASFTVYAGKTPYIMSSVQTGTVTQSGNRVLFGRKLDDAFVQIEFSGNTWATISACNLYPEGRGK